MTKQYIIKELIENYYYSGDYDPIEEFSEQDFDVVEASTKFETIKECLKVIEKLLKVKSNLQIIKIYN